MTSIASLKSPVEEIMSIVRYSLEDKTTTRTCLDLNNANSLSKHDFSSPRSVRIFLTVSASGSVFSRMMCSLILSVRGIASIIGSYIIIDTTIKKSRCLLFRILFERG